MDAIKARRDQYKVAALTCKRAGDIAQARKFLAVSKVMIKLNLLSIIITQDITRPSPQSAVSINIYN